MLAYSSGSRSLMPRGSSNRATPVASYPLTFRFCDNLSKNNAINTPHSFITTLSGGYRFLDHMTDAIIEAYGSTLDEAFENAAKGLVNTMFNIKEITPDQEAEIIAKGHDIESLLYDWLEKVMLRILIDNIVLSDFKVKISESNGNYFLKGIVKGEVLDLQKHHYKVEIKAVTYHEMEIKQKENIITTRFLLDL